MSCRNADSNVLEDGQLRKKHKTNDIEKNSPVLLPIAYSAERQLHLQATYASAKPFSHIRLTDICNDVFLRSARDVIARSLILDQKETDIFKVYQTTDLASLDESDALLSPALKLRDAVYSQEFRSFVEKITGCPPLTDQVDCSCSIYQQTGHLLCHDDAIGSRCISYILYLTDPDREWTDADGGRLELYSINDDGVPEVLPAKFLSPKWNQMVLFQVEPDLSYHSVEEVYTTADNRLTLSGWFHTSSEHARISHSSLNQLQNAENTPEPEFCFVEEQHVDKISEEDEDYLKNWVDSVYLNSANVDNIYQKFRDSGSIQLRCFLKAEKVMEAIAAMTAAEANVHEIEDVWTVVGPPNKRRHLKYIPDDADPSRTCKVGELLKKIEKDLFKNRAFCALLHQLTGLDITGGNSEVRCFRPGSDYTLGINVPNKRDTLDAVLCFLLDSDDEAKEQWENGDFGGFEVYSVVDGGHTGPVDVYRDDDGDPPVLSLSPISNTLSLVLSDEDMVKFVKYINAEASGCRWDISAEYNIAGVAPESSNTESTEEIATAV